MLEQAHESWMQVALALAEEGASRGEVPVGAVVVLENRIIGEGFNQPIGTHNPIAHAEIMALQAAAAFQENYRLPGATLYVTLEPCMMCAGALVHSRIKQLVYGAPEPKAGVVSSQARLLQQPFLNHRIAVTGGVLAEASSRLLSDFFRQRRRTKRQARRSMAGDT
jgi:tRNA(adenine34) deaminase